MRSIIKLLGYKHGLIKIKYYKDQLLTIKLHQKAYDFFNCCMNNPLIIKTKPTIVAGKIGSSIIMLSSNKETKGEIKMRLLIFDVFSA